MSILPSENPVTERWLPSLRRWLETATAAACAASTEILTVYQAADYTVSHKSDASPLTLADQQSHRIICQHLKATGLPVLSEEGKTEQIFATRQGWELFWLVDPLDGTREFIKRNGEFVVNIALIQGGRPLLGVVCVPVSGWIYGGCLALKQAWKRQIGQAENLPLEPLKAAGKRGEVIALASRSHPSAETTDFLARFPEVRCLSRGSALKFLALAEGEADFYPRFGPTREWDTAAPQALLEAVGGSVCTPEGHPLTYNKPSLQNPDFIACRPGFCC
jgi:3'(2'), 5'-bisphosphate nucleotidase